ADHIDFLIKVFVYQHKGWDPDVTRWNRSAFERYERNFYEQALAARSARLVITELSRSGAVTALVFNAAMSKVETQLKALDSSAMHGQVHAIDPDPLLKAMAPDLEQPVRGATPAASRVHRVNHALDQLPVIQEMGQAIISTIEARDQQPSLSLKISGNKFFAL